MSRGQAIPTQAQPKDSHSNGDLVFEEKGFDEQSVSELAYA